MVLKAGGWSSGRVIIDNSWSELVRVQLSDQLIPTSVLMGLIPLDLIHPTFRAETSSTNLYAFQSVVLLPSGNLLRLLPRVPYDIYDK